MALATLTAEMIEAWFGERRAAQGKRIWQQHRVLKCVEENDGALLIGAVRGDALEVVYSVLIRRTQGGEIKVKCDCLRQQPCVHAAALLYECIGQQKQESLFDFAELDAEQVEEPEAAPAAPFNMWLGMLGQNQGEAPAASIYPESVKQRLLYILERDGDKDVRLRFESARLLASGKYGKAQPYDPENILTYTPPQYILADDRRILEEVAKDRSFSSLRGYRLSGRNGLSIMKRIVASGRCHWQSKDSPPLKRGERMDGSWRWQLCMSGDQHLSLALDGREGDDGVVIVPTAPPWYIDTASGKAGPIASGQDADVAEILLNIPAIELDGDDALLQEVAEQLPDGVPVPKRLQHQVRRVEPLPRLTLKSMEVEQGWGYRQLKKYHVVALSFDYDGKIVDFDDGEEIRVIRDGKVIDYARDLSAEQQAAARLDALDLDPLSHFVDFEVEVEPHLYSLADATDWPEWVMYALPSLREDGFQIETDAAFAFKVEHAAAWELSLGEQQTGGLMAEAYFMVTLQSGEEIDLIDTLSRWIAGRPEMLQAEALEELRASETLPLPLADGRLLPAPGSMVASILHYMMDLFAAGPAEKHELSAPQMLALEQEMAAAEVPVQISSSVWLQQMRQLADLDEIPVAAPPAGLRAELRDYQKRGLSWMQFLRQMGFGGILADDMGLGKTVQVLAHILSEKEAGRLQQPALVVAPTSLMHNWRKEAEKFTPDLQVLVLHGPDRARHFAAMAEADLVLTTYPLLARDDEVLAAQAWHMLILDEAQYIKNPRAKVSQLVRQLQATHKLCMTGTPMENHLGELWAQFDFLMPGYLRDARSFSKLFRKPIELKGDSARQAALNVRLRPFMLRRAKEDVALELPPKTEMVRSIEIEGAQRELYESVRLAMQKRVRDAVATMGQAQSQIVVLDALLKMRQVCCDPRLISGIEKPPASAKLQMLMEMLPEMIEEGRRVLLFSQFTSMLKLIEEALAERGIDYVKLTGQSRDRATPVDDFQAGRVPLFLISLKAGGVGLNLTAADTVIHYDPWWNPAVEAQATDRAHRIGQDKAVFVYKLITEGTVEEKILELQARKKALADAIHQQAGAKPLWSPDELADLFAPMGA